MKRIYVLVGALLVFVGLLGFVMPSPLFRLFEVNVLHNAIHLASGAVTLVAATRGIGTMRLWGRIFGFAYMALAIAGFTSPDLFGLMHVTRPDNLMHLGLALVFLYCGLLAPPTL